MKRFYHVVESVAVEGGFAVTLDGKPVRTPGKYPLLLSTAALAEAVAEEWRGQGEAVLPATMPLLKLAATAIDRVAEMRADVAENAARYAGSDLLCYRAEHPEDLVTRQKAAWQPLLDWAGLRFDAPLRVTTSLAVIEQPAASLRAISNVLHALDVPALTAVADLTGLCGSVILALAIWDGRLDAQAAADAALLDEIFQAEHWGLEDEAAIRLANIRAEIAAAARFLDLLKAP